MCGRSVCPVWYGQKHLYKIQHVLLQLSFTTAGFVFPLASSFTLLLAGGDTSLVNHAYCVSIKNPSRSSLILKDGPIRMSLFGHDLAVFCRTYFENLFIGMWRWLCIWARKSSLLHTVRIHDLYYNSC